MRKRNATTTREARATARRIAALFREREAWTIEQRNLQFDLRTKQVALESAYAELRDRREAVALAIQALRDEEAKRQGHERDAADWKRRQEETERLRVEQARELSRTLTQVSSLQHEVEARDAAIVSVGIALAELRTLTRWGSA